MVFEVTKDTVVAINTIYIIPPGYDMTIHGGVLDLQESKHLQGPRLTIDTFLTSLALDQQEKAFAVILSGTGSDGSIGARAIKAAGGIVVVQKLASCEFDSMPRNALATGIVDFEFMPGEIPVNLIKYSKQLFSKSEKLTLEFGKVPQSVLSDLFMLLRAKTGHDFSSYKPSTIQRRIERRMAVHQVQQIDAYVEILRKEPEEIEALFYDLLIGVTNFFRDKEAFESLEKQVIPKLFEGRPPGLAIRIWSAGCSTGEEAYSIAILLQEYMEANKLSYPVQVFATDIDNRAIATARAGLFQASIASSVSPERLKRFFVPEANGYMFRIRKGVRDLLILSEHDLIKDPPFSKLDLICCRNLLIYFGSDLQEKLIPVFHYALKPNGILFLGGSEGIGEFGSLFSTLDRTEKIFQRRQTYQSLPQAALPRAGTLLSTNQLDPIQTSSKIAIPSVKAPLRELTENAILMLVAPVGTLVNEQGDILYLHGHTGSYLELPTGESSVNNILKMAREGLRQEMTETLQKAVSTKKLVRSQVLRFKTNLGFTLIRVTVLPINRGGLPESPLYLILIEEPIAQDTAPWTSLKDEQNEKDEKAISAFEELPSHWQKQIEILQQELRIKEEAIRFAKEELTASNEELRSFKEEMQSVNEELQSTNEELETSKEELQSVNEELATVNAELQTKVTDLWRSNNDMNNLLNGTGIGSVFVDKQLNVLRFTPAASEIINLIPGDVGRPLGHIVSNLANYEQLIFDTQAVLNTLVVKEVTVQSKSGRWYTMRIQPYRTVENVIEGAVITFVDSTEFVNTKNALLKANKGRE
jgi:two-component system CheB/CheR fusion protein